MEFVKKYLLRISLFLMIASTVCAPIIAAETDAPAPLYGQPVTDQSAININEIEMDQIADDGTYLYILDRHDGYVYVFDLDGNYQHTLMFWDYMNGSFRIAVHEQNFYVSDPIGDIYCYQNGQFIAFLQREEADEIISSVDFECNSENFEIRLGGIYRKGVDGDVCVIQRSAVRFSYEFGWILAVAVVVTVFILRSRNNK